MDIKPNDHILDIGCGAGRITAELAKRVPQGLVCGIDPSASMIQAAQQQKEKNSSFRIMNFEELNFHEEFDHIVSTWVFHWVKNQERALRNCAQALNPNGTLTILMSGNTIEGSPSIRAFYTIVRYERWQEKLKDARIEKNYFPLTVEQAKELIQKAALEPKKILLTSKNRIFPTIEAFKDFVRPITQGAYPFIRALSEQDQEQLFDDFMEVYLQLVPQNADGSVNYPIDVLSIEAIKK